MNSKSNKSRSNHQYEEQDDDIDYGPSKSAVKRECHHLLDIGEEILKLTTEDRHSLDLP